MGKTYFEVELVKGSISMKAAKLEIGVMSQEPGVRSQEKRGRRKKEGTRRSVFTNMRGSLVKVPALD